LNAEGKREWRRIVGILVECGLFTEIDRAALAMYCQAWGRWVEAERRVRKTGGEVLVSESSGNYYQNPHFHVANKAWDQLYRMLGQFGLSPAERSRVQAVTAGEREPSLAELLFSEVEGG